MERKPINIWRLGDYQLLVNGALAVLIATAALLRFYQIDRYGLWLDEIFTAIFASPENSLTEIIEYSLSTPLPTPPLWFLITHLFLRLFGTSDLVLRLPSIIAGVVGVFAVYKLGALLFDRATGLISAVLLTTSHLHVLASREGRYYAAIVLVSLLSYYALYRAIDTNEKKWWIQFTLICLVGVYIHLTMFLVLAAEVTFVGLLLISDLWRQGKPISLKMFRESYAFSFLLSMVAVGLLYLPMLPFLVNGLQGSRGLGNSARVEGFELSLGFFLDLFAGFGAGYGFPLALYVGAWLWGIGYGVHKYGRQTLLFASLMCVPFLVILTLSPKHWFEQKYVISLLPVYLMLIALGLKSLSATISESLRLARLPKTVQIGHLQSAALTALAVLYGVVGIPSFDEAYEQWPDHWEKVGDFLTNNVQPDDAVVILPVTFLTMSSEQLLNYYYAPALEENQAILTHDVGELEALLATHRRLWVVQEQSIDTRVAFDALLWLYSQPHVELAIGPKMTLLYAGLGVSESELLEEASEFHGSTAQVYGSIGKSYASLEMWNESVALYQKAAAIEPGEGIWHYRLAGVYEQLDRPDLALAEYQQAIHLEPDIAGFHAALGGFYRRTDRPVEALAEYQKAIDLWRGQFRNQGDSIYTRQWQKVVDALEQELD